MGEIRIKIMIKIKRNQKPPPPNLTCASSIRLRTGFTFSPATNRLAADTSKTHPFYELALS